jgi:ERG8-type phosphomevalonate kinase
MQGNITTLTPGKLILLGEYAVLEGAPALAAAVNRFARVSLHPLPGKEFRVSAPTIDINAITFYLNENGKVCFSGERPLDVSGKLDFFSATVEGAARYLRRFNVPLTPAEINLDTGDFFLEKSPEKLGLGSSAALTTGLFAALLTHAGKTVPGENGYLELFDLAVETHRAAQGNIGSGIDIAASTFGGVLQYQVNRNSGNRKPLIEHLQLPGELRMLVVWAGKSASTKEFVEKVNAFRVKNPKKFNGIMGEMAEISSRGCEALKTGKTAHFLEMAQQYYRQMDELGRCSNIPIISTEHRRIAEIVQSSGAVYKPSGAGGGDLGIAFGLSEKILKNCATELGSAGFKIIDIQAVSSGIQIKSNGVN